MTKSWASCLMLLLCCIWTAAGAHAQPPARPGDVVLPHQLKVCDDDYGWPPYLWKEAGRGEAVGYSVEVLERIAHKHNIAYQLDLLPWLRCLQLVAVGKYDMVLNASDNEQRRRDYLVTEPYYKTHSTVYYSRTRYPEGLKITRLSDLKHYHACGLLGYNYTNYGLERADIDANATTVSALLGKLKLGRCDLFIEKAEVMAGHGLTDAALRAQLSESWLGSAPLSAVPPTTYHMLVSKNTAYSAELLQVLNRDIAELAAEGTLAKLEKKFVP